MGDSFEIEMQNAVKSYIEITSENCRKMGEIWKELFGNHREIFNERLSAVGNHIQDLFNDMLAEEKERLQTAKEDMMSLMKEKQLLEQELGIMIDAPDPAEPRLAIIPLQYQLDTCLVNYRKLKEERMKALKQLQSRELVLCECMDYQPKYSDVKNLPSEGYLEEITAYLDTLESIKNDRYNRFRTIRMKILDTLNALQMNAASPFEQCVVNGDESVFKVSDENMKMLADLRDHLEEKMDSEKKRVMEMREKLSNLWDRLACDAKHREIFALEHEGFGKVTSDALRREISRCEEIKRENIELFVSRIRQELVSWWKKCFFSEEQSNAFAEYASERYDEELLDAHEREVERMKKYYDDNEDIFTLATKRAELWEEMSRLEGATNQPERLFNNRGGKLLQEEQKRKQIQKQLPRVEQILMKKLIDYENLHGAEFLYYGEPLKAVMDKQWQNRKITKDAKKVARQVQKNQPMGYLSKTPSSNGALRRVATPRTAPGGVWRGRAAAFTPLENVENIQPEAVSSRTPLRRVLNLGSRKGDVDSGTGKDDRELIQTPENENDSHSTSAPHALVDISNQVDY